MSDAPVLLLIRHGQTEWNVQRRVLGVADVPLDDTGRLQAAALATALGPIDALWSSPLGRAHATAEAVAGLLRTPGALRTESLITEMNQGELEGLGESDLLAQYGDLLSTWRHDPGGLRLPGGETMDEAADRALGGFARIAANSPAGARVAVVTHQVVIAAVLCRLHGEPLSRWHSHTHKNTAWSEVSWGTPPRVLRERVAPHLG